MVRGEELPSRCAQINNPQLNAVSDVKKFAEAVENRYR
jgi:hypothetical protein